MHKAQNTFRIYFGIGISLLTLVIVSLVVRMPQFSGSVPIHGATLASIEAESWHRHARLLWAVRYLVDKNIILKFSESMKENETQLITLGYSENLRNKALQQIGVYQRQSLYKPFTATIQSSGFTVTPEGENVAESGSPFPIELNWTVTPKFTGEHLLILRIPSIHTFTVRTSKNNAY